jgi:MFS family permease
MISYLSILCVLAASLSALGLGLDVGMISSTLVQPAFLAYFKNPSPSAIGGIVSAFSAGGTIGAFGAALIGDPFGRLWGLRSGCMIAILGVALQAGARNIAMLIVGRLISGWGAGQLTAIFPVYASEVAPPSIRGALGGLQMLMIECAIFIATAAGYGFGKHFTNDAQWRGPLAVQAIPLIIVLPLTFILPESPRWLVKNGKSEVAMTLLNRLHRGAGEAFVQGEYQEIVDQLTAEQSQTAPTWISIFRKPSWRRRVILSGLLMIFAQTTGINCIQYYTGKLHFRMLSVTSCHSSNLATWC